MYGTGREVLAGLAVQFVAVFEQGELSGHAERALAGTQAGGQEQGPARLVVVVQALAGLGCQSHTMPVGEARAEGPYDLARADADLLGQPFCREVGVVQVVLAAVEEVADLFVRRAGGLSPGVPAVGRTGEPFGQELVAAAEIEQDLGNTGHARGEVREVGR